MRNKNSILIAIMVFLTGFGIFLSGLSFTSDREELELESHEADNRNAELRKLKASYCSKVDSEFSQGNVILTEREIIKIHVLCPSLAEMYLTKE